TEDAVADGVVAIAFVVGVGLLGIEARLQKVEKVGRLVGGSGGNAEAESQCGCSDELHFLSPVCCGSPCGDDRRVAYFCNMRKRGQKKSCEKNATLLLRFRIFDGKKNAPAG